MRELRICLADEPLSLNLIGRIVDLPCDLELLRLKNKRDESRVTHGTLCMALLLQSLQSQGIINQVKISHFSLADKNSNLSYTKLLDAFDYCFDSKIDILSLSVGTTDRRDLDGMVERIAKLDRTLIIAAASNSFSLTYPAALPSVLGVKRSLINDAPVFARREMPSDGIDLTVNLPRKAILQKIAVKNEEHFANSNSIVVPPIVAEIAKKSITHKRIPTKEFALNILAGGSYAPDVEEYKLPDRIPIAEDEKTPIVLLPYHANMDMMDKAIRLQTQFELQGYSCGLMCQNPSSCDMKNGRYTLDTSRPNDCLRYYQEIVSESLILVLGDKQYRQLPVIDLCINEWQDMTIPALYSYILSKFGESCE